jgi:hypothetical protein
MNTGIAASLAVSSFVCHCGAYGKVLFVKRRAFSSFDFLTSLRLEGCMFNLFGLFAFLLLFGISTKSFAEFTPSTTCGGDGAYWLKGSISNLDAQIVRKVIRDKQSATPIGANFMKVCLDSPGGDIEASMEIGRSLRQVRAIAILTLPSRCFSACVFVLAGATQRHAWGKLGIHRPYSTRTGTIASQDAQREYTRIAQLSKTYLTEMNMPEQLYEAMVRIPPEEMKILSEYEATSFGLNTTDPVEDEVQNAGAAKAYGLTKEVYLYRKSLSKRVCDHFVQVPDIVAYDVCHARVMRTGQ